MQNLGYNILRLGCPASAEKVFFSEAPRIGAPSFLSAAKNLHFMLITELHEIRRRKKKLDILLVIWLNQTIGGLIPLNFEPKSIVLICPRFCGS
jgi:hypothetical protein